MNKQKIFYLTLPFLFISVYSLLYIFNVVQEFPSKISLDHWDVGWYKSIISDGYSFTEGKQSNVAFFPLFPYLWKYLGLSIIGITIFNYILSYTTIILLSINYKLDRIQTLLIATTPPLLFTFLPYSESLFFFFTAIFLIGLNKKQYLLCFIGIFFASLERSSALFFLPPFIYIFITSLLNKNIRYKQQLIYLSILIVASIGIGCVTLIQWIQTDEWFAFYKAQDAWEHHLKLPQFPLTTWSPRKNLPLDSFFTFIGLGLTGLLSYHFYCSIFKKEFIIKVSTDWIFSLVMLSEMFVFILLFQGGSMFSINRYIGATSFFIVLIIPIMKQQPKLTKNSLYVVSALMLIVWMSFGKLSSETFYTIQYLVLTAFTTLWILTIFSQNKKISYITIAFNLIMQVHFYHMFLAGRWVG